MREKYAIELLRRMVEIRSLSGEESELANYLLGEMNDLGFRSYIDGAGNVVGEVGSGEGPVILLLGHMDTVPGDVPVRQEGDLLYGRGTVDAKGPLATFILAAAAAKDVRARLIVIGAVEEETATSKGAHYLLDKYRPAAVIIGEPSGASKVVLGYKGRLALRYAISRPQGHSAGPGEKASELAVEFWNRLVAHCDELGGEKSDFYRPICTLSHIAATPEEAALEISCRIPPHFEEAAFRQFVESIQLDAQVEYLETTRAVVNDRSVAPARALMNAIREQGEQPGLVVKTGTSDMNVVATRWDVPMVAYGPGDSSLDHTPNEHVDLHEYLRAIEVLTSGVRALAAELAESYFQQPTEVYTEEEEEEMTQRLQALGYLD